MTLPESTVAKVREGLNEGLKWPNTFGISSHILALLDAPPPAMGGLPDDFPRDWFWCTSRHSFEGYSGGKCCIPVEVVAHGTRDRLGELITVVRIASESACEVYHQHPEPGREPCGECPSCRARAILARDGVE